MVAGRERSESRTPERIRKISERQRTALILRYHADLSVEL
jgi:hypothetical protein